MVDGKAKMMAVNLGSTSPQLELRVATAGQALTNKIYFRRTRCRDAFRLALAPALLASVLDVLLIHLLLEASKSTA